MATTATTPCAPPTPLWASLSVTFASSLGTGVVTSGIFFLTQAGLGFDRTLNFWLALAIGGSYIAGAMGVGPMLRRAAASHPWLSTRAVLAGVLVALAAICQLPLIASVITGSTQAWTIWALALIYSPITGCLWPIIESSVSGGRSGRQLRAAIGRFNIVWAGAMMVAYWAMAPLVATGPLLVISILGGVHLATLVLLRAFRPEPGSHTLDNPRDEPAAESYPHQLSLFRVLLPVTYVFSSALGPLLAAAMPALSVAVVWRTPLASLWLMSRLMGFVGLERWHGWHGRSWVAPAGAGLLLVGFALCAAASGLGGDTGLVLLIVGLVLFGAANAIIYSAALYYAMAVGNADVRAGGVHEALIGVGYTLGPGCALLATAATSNRPDRFDAALVIAAVLVSVLFALSARRLFRRPPPGHGSEALK